MQIFKEFPERSLFGRHGFRTIQIEIKNHGTDGLGCRRNDGLIDQDFSEQIARGILRWSNNPAGSSGSSGETSG